MRVADTDRKFLQPLRNFLERHSDLGEWLISSVRNFYDNSSVRKIRNCYGVCWVTNKPREGRQRDEGSVDGLGLSILLVYDELRDWLWVTRIRNTCLRVRWTGVVCGNVASGGALGTAGG